MREAARALDNVSDHLGEVLRRADELLVEWSTFAAQVRSQVEREAGAVGHIVESAVGRVAAQGIDRAIGDRLRALTLEIERLEQRTRAASRAVVEQRDHDRRILWAVVAGIVLANALLVVLLLRKPAPAPAAEPVRIDSAAQPSAVEPAQPPTQAPAQGTTPAAADPTGASTGTSGASAVPASGSGSSATAPAASAPSTGASASPGAASRTGSPSGAAPQGASPQGASPQGASPQSASPQSPSQTGNTAGAAKGSTGSGARANEPVPPRPSPMSYPVRPGPAHPHKKLP